MSDAPTVADVLREALDQYVANQTEHTEHSETVTDADRAKLVVAEAVLDDLNTQFINGAGIDVAPAGRRIRRMLDASTGNLPEDLFEALTEHPWISASRTEHGALMWVPDDPEDSARSCDPPIPPEVLAVQKLARGLDCDYVRFDADADPLPAVPNWDW